MKQNRIAGYRISCNFLEPDSDIRPDIRLIALPDIRPDNTGYPAGYYQISGQIITDIWTDTASLLDKAKLAIQLFNIANNY